MSVADKVAEIVKRASAAAPDDRAEMVLKGIRALPDIEELPGPLAFRSGNHEIQVGLKQNLEKTAKNLTDLKSMKLSIAPQLVAHLPFGDESVLVARYAGIDGERLVPVKPGPGPGQTAVPAAARERFKKDVEALAARGLVHPYASRGFANWLQSSNSKTLALDNWAVMRPADKEECAAQLEKIDALLGRLG